MSELSISCSKRVIRQPKDMKKAAEFLGVLIGTMKEAFTDEEIKWMLSSDKLDEVLGKR